MQYFVASDVNISIKKTVAIHNFYVDLINNVIGVSLCISDVNSEGKIVNTYVKETISNQNGKIVSPGWNENSNPPKPLGFDILDKNTWGTLLYEEIPFVTNPATQYMDIYNQHIADGKTQNEAILRTIIDRGSIGVALGGTYEE